ncbi:FAD-dependent monooxygenase [Amycolatopsis sp. NPDC059657]|uniref:FAD-dependent monooxygenase n=1 Tax=Amycolatopsis sp. NPDC059657 TaxID=3346899 RepID=UPI00366BC305
MTQVLIVGGGPVGMLLAAELGLQGIDTTVAETLTETHDEPRAGTLHARTVQSMLRRGYIPQPAHGRDDIVEVPFHFAGRSILTLETPAIEGPPMIGQSQADIERFFEARARENGAEILRGHKVISLEDTTVTTDQGKTISADYVVGTDGARSTIRKLAGIDSTCTPATFAGILGLATLQDPARCPGGWTHGPTGWTLINVNPMGPSRILTHEFTDPLPERGAEVTLDDLQQATSRIVGHDVPMEQPTFLGRFSDFTRLASTYRKGNVFLAGDAAHVHAPLGGQGLNLGLQDAFNLGWKLAMVIKGAPERLLDTYHAERHPVAAKVIANTRAQAALMRPGPEFDPLRELVAELLSFDEPNSHLSDQITAQNVRYTPSGLAGSFLPNFPIGSATVSELLHPGRPVLLCTAETCDAATGWKDRVDVVTHDLGRPAVLLRPDGYVAWAGQDPETALEQWFGPAA